MVQSGKNNKGSGEVGGIELTLKHVLSIRSCGSRRLIHQTGFSVPFGPLCTRRWVTLRTSFGETAEVLEEN